MIAMNITSNPKFAPIATVNGKSVYSESAFAAAMQAGKFQAPHKRVYVAAGRIVPDQCDVTGHDGVIYCRVLSEATDSGMEWQNAATKVAVSGMDLIALLDAQWVGENPGVENVLERGNELPVATTPTPVAHSHPVNAGPLNVPTPVVPVAPAGSPSVQDQINAAIAPLLAALAAKGTTPTDNGKGNGKGKGKGGKNTPAKRERGEYVANPKMEFRTIAGRDGDFRKLCIDDGRTFNPQWHAYLSARHCALILANADAFWGMVQELAHEAD